MFLERLERTINMKHKKKQKHLRVGRKLMMLVLVSFLIYFFWFKLYLPAIADPPVRIALCDFDQYFIVCGKRWGRIIVFDDNFKQLYRIAGLQGEGGSYSIMGSHRLPVAIVQDYNQYSAILFFEPNTYQVMHLDDYNVLSLHDDFDAGQTWLIVEDEFGIRSSIKIGRNPGDCSIQEIEKFDCEERKFVYSFKVGDKHYGGADWMDFTSGALWENTPLIATGQTVRRSVKEGYENGIRRFDLDLISIETMILINGELRDVKLTPDVPDTGGHLAVGYRKVVFLPWKTDQVYSWIAENEGFKLENHPPKSSLNWIYFPKYLPGTE